MKKQISKETKYILDYLDGANNEMEKLIRCLKVSILLNKDKLKNKNEKTIYSEGKKGIRGYRQK